MIKTIDEVLNQLEQSAEEGASKSAEQILREWADEIIEECAGNFECTTNEGKYKPCKTADTMKETITVDVEELAYEIASWVANDYYGDMDRWTITAQVQKIIRDNIQVEGKKAKRKSTKQS